MAEPEDVQTTPNAPPRPKWYHNLWFVLFILIFVAGPLGLPLVWNNPRFSRGMKIALTVVMVAYTVLVVALAIRTVRFILDHSASLSDTMSW